ncbi:helix-turn-helix domain-containing protein [Rhodococcus sp. UFZ-B548]|uniref:helix-turn-helix domain-containing protein n=1 Tax=Rhodococcus sp. UFZ-B548 TaxID=2742212 RepID=UPI0015F71A1E|nr:helix-turn-helix transcriptional regulator [Rhodococcus sp. UFZ-B548]
MANEVEWSGPSLSDRVADQIVAYRKRPTIAMNREQLAQRCAELGAPGLTFAALTNIETGRKKDGKRRRDITIDELVVIARALRVPPAVLMFPVGLVDEVEPVPSVKVPTWGAYKWFVGSGPMPTIGDPGGGEYDEATGVRDWYNDPEAGWEVGAAPITLRNKHDQLVEILLNDFPYGELDMDREESEGYESTAFKMLLPATAKRQFQDDLRSVRAEMRRHGLTPPRLPDDLRMIEGKL